MRLHKKSFGLSLDSLLDTMTNVVGILIVILAVTHLSVGDAVKRISTEETSPTISQETLAHARNERDKIESLLAKLRREWGSLKTREPEARIELERLKFLLAELERLAQMPNRSLDQQQLSVEATILKGRLAELEKQIQLADKHLKANESRFARLLAADTKPKELRVPTLQPAPKDLKALAFACRNGRIYPIDGSLIFERFHVAVKKATGKGGRRTKLNSRDVSKIQAYLKKHDVGDSYFRLEVEDLSFILLIRIKPRRINQGETIEQMRLNNSAYRKILRSTDPNNQFVKFFVWSDSFDIYLAAKEIAEGKGLQGNWIPMRTNEDLMQSIGSGSSSPEKIMW